MAELIIDALEAIDVDQQERGRGRVAPQPLDGVAHAALHVATIEGAGQRVHDRLVEEPAVQVDDDAQDDVGEHDGESQRDEDTDGVREVDVVIHQRADDEQQQDAAYIGHAPRQAESEEQDRGVGPQGAEKALDLEGSRSARRDGDEQENQRNGRGFLQVDGESVDGENEERGQNSRSQPVVPLHERVHRERKQADRRRTREPVQDPPAIGGEGILSGLDWAFAFHCAPPGSQSAARSHPITKKIDSEAYFYREASIPAINCCRL